MTRYLAIAAFLFYAALIAYLSLTPTGAIPVGDYDKSAHFLSYTVFAVIGSFIQLAPRRFIALCVGIVLYSGLMEFGQSFVPNRVMSLLDFAANSLGVLVGYYASGWIQRRRAGKPGGSPAP